MMTDNKPAYALICAGAVAFLGGLLVMPSNNPAGLISIGIGCIPIVIGALKL